MPKERHALHEYTSHNGVHFRVTFVASVLPGYDWSCHVLGSIDATAHDPVETDGALTEDDAARACANKGNKLREEVARALFPDIKERYND